MPKSKRGAVVLGAGPVAAKDASASVRRKAKRDAPPRAALELDEVFARFIEK
jgi:hypothetical protein